MKMCSLEGNAKFIETLRATETFVKLGKIQTVDIEKTLAQPWLWKTSPTSIFLTF